VTAEETRADLLAAAAKVFGESGYEGASIAAITHEAGLSSGSVYAHYASKAELFVAAMEAHGTRQIEVLLGNVDELDAAEYAQLAGSELDRRDPNDVALLVEAIVASKRHPDMAQVVQPYFTAREDRFAAMVRQGQSDGVIHDGVTAEAIARMAMMLALGSLLTEALGMPNLDHEDWTCLMARLVDGFREHRPPTPTARRRSPPAKAQAKAKAKR
jgi:AcrR family transcriptional regulator